MSSTNCPPIRRSGITVLWAGADCVVDIIFLHGLNGSPDSTWKHPSTGFYWPWEMRRHIPDSRIMVFGYDADVAPQFGTDLIRIRGLAESFLSSLVNKRQENMELKRPLIMVAHSLGGLIIKKALVLAAQAVNTQTDDAHLIYESTSGLVFLGTPHSGSAVDKRKRLSILKKLAKVAFIEVPPKLESALEMHSDELCDLADDFRKITLWTERKLIMYTYFETRTTAAAGECVVDETSARIGYDKETTQPIQADHENMVKYRDNDDAGYENLWGKIKILKRKALSINPDMPLEHGEKSNFLHETAVAWPNGTQLPDSNPATFRNSSPLFTYREKIWTRILRNEMASEGRQHRAGTKDLIEAVFNEDIDSVVLLLRGASFAPSVVNFKDENGRSALMAACLRGNPSIMGLLLDAGADPNACDSNKWTPMMCCIFGRNRYVAMQALLLNNAMNLEIAPVGGDHAVLAEACRLSQWDAVRMLVEHGANVRAFDCDGYPVLVRAVQMGAPYDIVELMLKKKADPNTPNKHRWTPVCEALSHRRWRLLRLLIEQGASVDVTHEGAPMIPYLTLCGPTELDLVEMVLDREPASLDRKNWNDWTGLREACYHGHEDIAKLLLRRGAQVNDIVNHDKVFPERHEWTYLMQAAASARAGIVLDLLDYGAEVDAVDRNGYTALRLAIDNHADGVACLLLARGADVYKRDKTDRTPLAQARAHAQDTLYFIFCCDRRGL